MFGRKKKCHRYSKVSAYRKGEAQWEIIMWNISLRKEIEKEKTLNLRFSKGTETLDEIIKVQCSPLVKTGLGYIRESSQSSAPRYLNAAKANLQHYVTQPENKETS